MEIIYAIPKAMCFPTAEAREAALWEQPTESASRFDLWDREQVESQAQMWDLHCFCISKISP